MCMFCRSLFVFLYFSFWPLYCLFFDIRILITPLVSLNSSSSNRLELYNDLKNYRIFCFVCKSYYYECLIKELGINKNTSGNTTYKPTSFDKDEILANHRSFMTSLNIPSGKESEDLPYLYWIPKLHKTPYKERYIAGSLTCSTKELSIHLTKILSAVKEEQQKYCDTVYSRSGINHMWILKNSKDLSVSVSVSVSGTL